MWRQLCGVASCVEDLASLRRSGKPLLGGEELYRGPECSICVERPTLSLRPAGPSLLSSAVLTLWPQSSSSAAYASTGRYRLKRGAPWCHQQSLSQRQPVLTAPPLRPSPAAQVSRGHFVVGLVFGLLGSGGETLTAGWPIVSWPVPSLQSGWLWHSWSLY